MKLFQSRDTSSSEVNLEHFVKLVNLVSNLSHPEILAILSLQIRSWPRLWTKILNRFKFNFQKNDDEIIIVRWHFSHSVVLESPCPWMSNKCRNTIFCSWKIFSEKPNNIRIFSNIFSVRSKIPKCKLFANKAIYSFRWHNLNFGSHFWSKFRPFEIKFTWPRIFDRGYFDHGSSDWPRRGTHRSENLLITWFRWSRNEFLWLTKWKKFIIRKPIRPLSVE